MIDFDLILENENILLRPMKRSDLEQFALLTKNQSMWKYFTSDLSLISELENWVDTAIRMMNKKVRLPFTIIDKKDNKIIGSSSFGNISEHDYRIEIGWTWLGKEYHGKGINTQIKSLMLKYCFENINLERVEFKTDVLNIPARKALLRLGIIEEGILRSHTVMTHNRRRDTIYYSILRTEWYNIKAKYNW